MQRFYVLDSFRGMAALLVALYHLKLSNPITDNALVDHSYLMVDFFFVLSGFIISHTYFYRWNTNFYRFSIVRLARLYPLHIYTLLVIVVFEVLKFALISNGTMSFSTPAFSNNNGMTFVENFLMFDSFPLLGNAISWNDPSWSISAEFYSNIFIAGLIVLLSVNSKTKFITLSLALLVGSYVALKLLRSDPDSAGEFGIIRCFYGFSLGMLVYALHEEIAERLVSKILLAILEGVSLFSLIYFVIRISDTPDFSVQLVFAVTVLIFAREGGIVSRFLKHRALTYIGEISYSIYLNHFILSVLFQKIYDRAFPGGGLLSSFAATALYLLAILIYSHFTYRIIERPLRYRFKNMLIMKAANRAL